MEFDLIDFHSILGRHYSDNFEIEYDRRDKLLENHIGEMYINGNPKNNFSFSLEKNCRTLVVQDFRGKIKKRDLGKIIDLNEDIAQGLGFVKLRVITERGKVANEFYKKGYEFNSNIGEKIL